MCAVKMSCGYRPDVTFISDTAFVHRIPVRFPLFGGAVMEGCTGRISTAAPKRACVSFCGRTRLNNGRSVIVIFFSPGEKKKIFVSPGWPVMYGFRHGIGFMPDNIAAQIPAILLQREGQPPRYAHQVFVFESLWYMACGMSMLVSCASWRLRAGISGIAVPHVEP